MMLTISIGVVLNSTCIVLIDYFVLYCPLQLPHTSKEVLPLRPGPASNGTQPVNIVRPLRPAPSPHLHDVKVPRPPPPISKPLEKAKCSPIAAKLSPPKKPLPLNPTRSPVVKPIFLTLPALCVQTDKHFGRNTQRLLFHLCCKISVEPY